MTRSPTGIPLNQDRGGSHERGRHAGTARGDAGVVGAGVVGLACARALARAGREVLILERERDFGTGISSRNSEVIHAGLYYPPGSRKARLCVAGREALYRFCGDHRVDCARLGKLVVAVTADQEPALAAL